jgi:hypothetical protein
MVRSEEMWRVGRRQGQGQKAELARSEEEEGKTRQGKTGQDGTRCERGDGSRASYALGALVEVKGGGFNEGLEHVVNELVDVFLAVAPGSALDEGMALDVEASLGWVELEGPSDEVARYQRRLLASLKWGPQEAISWMRSSTQMMPYFPRYFSICSLD